MNKTLSLLATLGLMAAAPVVANAEMGKGAYTAFDVGFGSIDHELNDEVEAGGSSIGLNAAVGYRQPLTAMGMDMFWGAELGFGFGSLDEDETTTTVATAVDPDGTSPAADARKCYVDDQEDTAASNCATAAVNLNQTFTAEESWNFNLSADIGMMVNSNTLAFLRVGYVYAGGADASYAQNVVDGDTSAAPAASVFAESRTNKAYADKIYTEARKDTQTGATITDANNNVLDRDTSEADASVVIGVGGEYDMSKVSPGLSVRGLALYNIGDRSGVDIRVGVGWQF